MGGDKISSGFECCEPILRVGNMAASLQFYVGLLGFQNASWGNEHFTHISRGGAGIYLSHGEQGAGRAWVWIGVDDVDRLYSEYKAAGLTVRLPPTNYSWALEMQIEDPDGNVLRMGSAPKNVTGDHSPNE